jgi:hypothetical protein
MNLRKSATRRRAKLWLEMLEDRVTPSSSVIESLSPAAWPPIRPLSATTPPVWQSYGHDPQHTGISQLASVPLDLVRWSTPVDLHPQYSGGDLLIHYGSPLVTAANTVIVPLKTGTTSGFAVEAFHGSNGNLKWMQTTNYVLPAHNWTPSYSPTLTPGNRLYFAGAGGTLYYMDSPDATGATITGQIAFFGIDNYNANPTAYNNAVFINTPITSDSAGDIFFGFQVTGSTPLGLQSGIARIDANGQGTWVAASTAAGDTGITQVVTNCAPALSNDQSKLYIAVSTSYNGRGYLLDLNSATLSRVAEVALHDVRLPANNSTLPSDGTASPTVGPDGDVYFGVLENPFATSKGWLLHFSGDLSQTKTPGAFGWDDTASIVPAAMVPSYHGTSTYLLMTKYNNYGDTGGDGVNKLAILDPNDTQIDARTGATVMKEILTIAGVTRDPNFPFLPNAVREWCINTAAVDPATDSVLANSEDGRLYRWNLATNTFTEVIGLTTATGEAYTPTVIGVDGTVFAINNATLFAVQAEANPFVVSSTPSGNLFGPQSSVRVTFDRAIDVSTFTIASIDSFTRTVGSTTTDLLSTITGVTPVAGSDNHQFDITFATQNTLGVYTLVIGPNILDLAGNPMDQDHNGIPGEDTDVYTATFAIQGPRIIAQTPSGNNNFPNTVNHVRLTFNEPINPSSFDASDVFIHGPSGGVPVNSVTAVAGSNNTQFDINFALQTKTGNYDVLVLPFVTDLFGNPLDQDQDFVGGSLPDDIYVGQFGVLGPKVNTAVPNGSLQAGLAHSVRLTFNEAMDLTTINTASIVSFTGPNGPVSVLGIVPVGTSATQFDVVFDPLTVAGNYTLVLSAGMRDVFGNQMDQDGNLIPGELSDRFMTTFTVAGPQVLSVTPTGNLLAPVDHVQVSFNTLMNASSFTPDRVTFTGPAGPAGVISVTPVPFTNNTQFVIAFAPQSVAGDYSLSLSPDITDIYGNPLGLQAATELVRNGGFENPLGSEWVIISPSGTTVRDTTNPHTGVAALALGQAGQDASVTQAIATIPGQQYTFSFWYFNTGQGPNDLHALWNGSEVYAEVNAAAHGYEQHTFTVTAADSLTTIQFLARNDPTHDFLDDVSVVPTSPTPFTTRFTIASPAIGTDGFGYTATSVAAQNLEILGQPGTFTIIQSGTNVSMPVNLGSDHFNFYGDDFTGSNQLFVYSNGLISFRTSLTAAASAANTNLLTSPLQAVIAPLWAAWTTGAGSPMVLGKFEDIPGGGRRLIIEWNQLHRVGSVGNQTFQVVLTLDTGNVAGDILFNYANLQTTDATAEGNNATVGLKAQVEGGSGTFTPNPDRFLVNNVGTTPYAHTGQAIYFSSGLRVTDASPSSVSLAWSWKPFAVVDGYKIEKSTDGINFAQIAMTGADVTTFTDTDVAQGGTYFYRVRAFNATGDSPYSNVDSAQLAPIDHLSDAFANHDDLTANGSTLFTDAGAQVTGGGMFLVGSIFSTSRVEITSFTTSFTFQFSPGSIPVGNGITFTIQGDTPTTVGPAGGGLGYGPDAPSATSPQRGIRNSVAVKFKTVSNAAGETTNSTGLFTDGRSPSVPEAGSGNVLVNLDPNVINFSGPDPIRVDMTYDGTTLNVTITDTVTLQSAMQSYTVDIPALVGGNAAYVGFTGATGGVHFAFQVIQSWTFQQTAAGGGGGGGGRRARSAGSAPTGSPSPTSASRSSPPAAGADLVSALGSNGSKNLPSPVSDPTQKDTPSLGVDAIQLPATDDQSSALPDSESGQLARAKARTTDGLDPLGSLDLQADEQL